MSLILELKKSFPYVGDYLNQINFLPSWTSAAIFIGMDKALQHLYGEGIDGSR